MVEFHARQAGDAARSADRGQPLARDVGAAARRRPLAVGDLARPSKARCLLAAGLGHRGLCGDRVPGDAVCGWEDSYSNFVPRLLAGFRGRASASRALVARLPLPRHSGPQHRLSAGGVRWWRHWLGARRPASWRSRSTASGSAGRSGRGLLLSRACGRLGGRGELAESADRASGGSNSTAMASSTCARPRPDRSVRSPATAGADCGRWGGYGGTMPDMAIDQRREDGQGLCFETRRWERTWSFSAPWSSICEVTGRRAACDADGPTLRCLPGRSLRARDLGVLNLSPPLEPRDPEPCPVGTPFRVRLRLNDVGRAFPKGHRIRIGLATQHWPISGRSRGLSR